jgi:hypothetical protein
VQLHELVYKNYKDKDLIKRCIIHVNDQVVDYVKQEEADKTYYIDGSPETERMVTLSDNEHIRFSLEVSCEDFSRCHCRQHKFQLNISAVME